MEPRLLKRLVFTGRVLTQNSPVMPPRTITLSEPHNTSIQSIPGKKIAISPLKTPSKVNQTHLSSIMKQTIRSDVSHVDKLQF